MFEAEWEERTPNGSESAKTFCSKAAKETKVETAVNFIVTCFLLLKNMSGFLIS